MHTCEWDNCDETFTSMSHMVQHISYHGYLAMLRGIGENVLKRYNLPDCKMKWVKDDIAFLKDGYICQWEYCKHISDTIYDFLDHMKVHVANNPRVAGEAPNEIIACCWRGK